MRTSLTWLKRRPGLGSAACADRADEPPAVGFSNNPVGHIPARSSLTETSSRPRQSRIVAHDRPEGAAAPWAVTSLVVVDEFGILHQAESANAQPPGTYPDGGRLDDAAGLQQGASSDPRLAERSAQPPLGVMKGLPDEAPRQAVLPSGWTCLAMLRHLAVDDERFWFCGVAAAEPVDLNDATGWQPSPEEPAAAAFELYRQEIAASDAVLAGLELDAAPARWPDYFGDWRLHDVREIILHVIAETAVHAGHLDAARELIDGRTWLGPDDSRLPRD